MSKRWLVVALCLLTLGSAGAQDGEVPTQDAGGEEGLLDVEHYDIEIEIDPERAFIRGDVSIRFKALRDSLTLPFHLSSRLTLVSVEDATRRYTTRYSDFASERMLVKGDDPFAAGQEYELRFQYEGSLETEQYAFLDTPENSPAFINRDGAVLLTPGNWFPNHDLPLDRATVQSRIVVPLGFGAVAPGTNEGIEPVGVSEAFIWKVDTPIGAVPVVIARFLRQSFDLKPLPISLFVREDLNRDLKPLAERIASILDFYTSQYGPPPIQSLALAQVGRVDLSEMGGMGLTLLDYKLLDPADPPLLPLAKRLALQWWGYPNDISSESDAWLRDGFATYSALRYLEQTTPDRYETALAFQAVEALKYEQKAPISDGLALEPGSEQYESIVGSKGAWVLYMLSQLVGQERFDSIIDNWYRRIGQGKTSTAEFQSLVDSDTGENYRWFFVQWIESVGVPEFRVDYTVFKRRDGNYRIKGQVKQDLELFRMPVDIRIETKGTPEEKNLVVSGHQTSFDFQVETLPLKIEIDPHGKVLLDSDEMRKRVHMALGQEMLEQNEYVAAVAEFESARRIDPRSSLVHYLLGETYFKQTTLNLAANSFRDALNGDLQPEWVETWTHIYLGKIYDVLGQRQRALAEYQKAINSEIDYNGAQEEAKKYVKNAYSKPSLANNN